MFESPILTRIRQEVSAGNCVAGMIASPRKHTLCSANVDSASTSIVNLLHAVDCGTPCRS